MKMECNVYYNNYGFKIGTKYAYVIKAYSGKVVNKAKLTPELIAQLQEIKNDYNSYDVNRTARATEIIELATEKEE